MKTKRKNRDLLSWLLGVFLIFFGLFFVFHWFSFTELSHRLFAKRVQRAVLIEDEHLQQSKHDFITAFDQAPIPVKTGVYVFKSDSLMYWNNNLIEPKVLRKRVGVPVDTIVNIGMGDFLLSSCGSGPYTFYFFSLINTTYPVENNYFVNRFLPVWGTHAVSFGNADTEGSFPVYSKSGKHLSSFTLEFPEPGHSSNRSLLVICGMMITLCLYLLVVRRIAVRKPQATTVHRRPVWQTITYVAVMMLAVCLGFSRLFRVMLEQGFMIPGNMRINHCLLWLFLGCLALLTATLWLRKLIIPQLLLWGVLLTYLYDHEYTRFENRQIQNLAVELSQERDTCFEQSYLHFLDDIQDDTVFNQMIFSDDVMQDVVQDYMHSFLYDSIMNNYNTSIAICSPNQELIVHPFEIVTDCETYFQERIETSHGVELDNGLWLMDDNTLDPGYLSMISLKTSDSLFGTVFLEFSKPVVPQGFGLPKIIRDDHNALLLKSSVASYRDSLLVYKFGSYVFPNFLADYNHPVNAFSYGRRMKHYVYRADEHKVLAITLARRRWMEMTTPFVVFFGMLLVLYLMVYAVGQKRRGPHVFRTLSSRFQMLVLTALGISFLVIGPISVIYLQSFYTTKSNEAHFERIRTLSLNVTSEVDFSFLKEPGFKTTLDRILWHYSETFFTDINVYGVDGRLMATTSPELVDMHLQSSLMNAEAFQNMQGEKQLYYSHDERLGNAVYQSSYIAIQDDAGNTLAYLNTPFFSSQPDLRLEILNYVLTYVNIILLISFVVLAIVLVITQKVTGPLVKLQEKMRQVDINKSNEQLEWKSKDEIGALINQYNLLVLELEKSAAELRRTAAESAWRGVARQVAHEIKNSLTPMRLSVQMLQRSAEQQGGEVDERLQRTAKTLLEQIDSLSDIASSFSSYAKLPENHPQPLDLAELVGNVVNLYDNVDNIEFQYTTMPAVDYTFNGDKTNLNSAFGNIIKNATQAIGDKPNGKIEVTLKATDQSFVIAVKDNGKGIKEEDKKMIFLPNFTTKSGGSGVGMSLTFNIIQSAGGSISFESTEGEGATFVVELPRTTK